MTPSVASALKERTESAQETQEETTVMTARRLGCRAVTGVCSCVSCAGSVCLRVDVAVSVIADLHIKTIVFVCVWESRLPCDA